MPAAIVTGRKVRALISGIISSTAKMMAPSGVLKAAASPAAAPEAVTVMRCQSGSFRKIAIWEAMAAPIWMTAASRPTEPPLPLVMPAARDFSVADQGRTLPSR